MPPAERIAGSSRPLPRVLVAIAALLLLARIGAGVWEARNAPQAVDRVAWVALSSAAAEAKRTQKPILYDFSAAWCAPCAAMASDLFDDPATALRIGSAFVPVRVVDRQREDGRNPPEVEALEHDFGVRAFPTLVVAWPGSPRFEKLEGYRGAQPTLQWMSQSATMARMRRMGMLPDSATVPR